MESPSTPHIAIVPTPGMGHLIPLIEFAKRLVHKHHFSATFIIPTNGPPSRAQEDVVKALPPAMDAVFLPPVTFEDLDDDVMIETQISLTIVRSLPFIRDAVKSMVSNGRQRLVALVVDLFGTDVFEVATEFSISPYIFYPSTAMVLSLFLYLPKLDAAVSCEYRDLPEPVNIPGCIPIQGRDLLDPIQDRKNDANKWVLHHCKRYHLAEGIMANSFPALEGGALRALQEEETGKPRVYPIGPLIQTRSTEPDVTGCLRWLDEQPLGSVLFVSFGSGGTLSRKQLTEVALGLEMSEQRFLWVVRTPSDKVANATYFTHNSHKESPVDYLPEGFIERTAKRALLLPSWAPQIQVLSHGSVGGFLTHCGWNSALESVVHGVPLIAWPLYAEQRMNAVMLTEDLKVALRPKADEKGIVGKEELGRVVKDLMEGEEGKKVRSRMQALKDEAAIVLSDEGSSTKALSQLASKWKNHSTT